MAGIGPPYNAEEVAWINERMKEHADYRPGMGVRPADNAPTAGYEYVGDDLAATHVIVQWAIAELTREGRI